MARIIGRAQAIGREKTTLGQWRWRWLDQRTHLARSTCCLLECTSVGARAVFVSRRLWSDDVRWPRLQPIHPVFRASFQSIEHYRAAGIPSISDDGLLLPIHPTEDKAEERYRKETSPEKKKKKIPVTQTYTICIDERFPRVFESIDWVYGPPHCVVIHDCEVVRLQMDRLLVNAGLWTTESRSQMTQTECRSRCLMDWKQLPLPPPMRAGN